MLSTEGYTLLCALLKTVKTWGTNFVPYQNGRKGMKHGKRCSSFRKFTEIDLGYRHEIDGILNGVLYRNDSSFVKFTDSADEKLTSW